MTASSFVITQAFNTWEKSSFEYGRSDCCKFAAHVVSEITGRDYSAKFDYHSEDEAAALIEHHGGLAGLISHILGVPSGDNYSDGDPVMIRLPVVGDAMGIKLGAFAVCLTRKGLTKVPQRHIIEGWPICHQ